MKQDNLGIPKNIITFWHENASLPPLFAENIKTTLKNNHGCNHLHLDDHDALALVEEFFPHLAEFYREMRIPAARSDISRLVALYLYGGVYVDVSMIINEAIHNHFDPTDQIFVVRQDTNPIFKNWPHAANILNGLIGAEKNSGFILECLKKSFTNLHFGLQNYSVSIATGPNLITETYLKICNNYKHTLKNYSELTDRLLTHTRIDGVNNTWVEQQMEGIVNPGFYSTQPLHDVIWAKACENSRQNDPTGSFLQRKFHRPLKRSRKIRLAAIRTSDLV